MFRGAIAVSSEEPWRYRDIAISQVRLTFSGWGGSLLPAQLVSPQYTNGDSKDMILEDLKAEINTFGGITPPSHALRRLLHGHRLSKYDSNPPRPRVASGPCGLPRLRMGKISPINNLTAVSPRQHKARGRGADGCKRTKPATIKLYTLVLLLIHVSLTSRKRSRAK